MWYYGVILSNCDCFVDNNNDLHICIDDLEVFVERGCGFNRDIVYEDLSALGYL